MFDDPDNIKKDTKIKDVKVETPDKGEENKQIEEVRKAPFGDGPFVEKMKILKRGNYRIEGKLYKLIPGDFIDGSKLDPRKKDILINTRFIVKV